MTAKVIGYAPCKVLVVPRAARLVLKKILTATDGSQIDTAKENSADIIIMGSYGRTGLKRLLMGSVCERVIGYAECAVLIVKA